MSNVLTLRYRSQQLVQDDWGGFTVNAWKVRTRTRKVPADLAAILICDMWDRLCVPKISSLLIQQQLRSLPGASLRRRIPAL